MVAGKTLMKIIGQPNVHIVFTINTVYTNINESKPPFPSAN